ncbi:putative disease resistance protein RGA3 [Aristolochia californica]|uniref:putative disease resistance protein RGA3 n=1 Tax=Aristolochia californica TaxID=171875 RepID=UPI0035D6E0F0
MAEIVLSPLLDRVIGSIGSALGEEIEVVWGVEEELRRLSSTLSAINSLMADAEEKQLHSYTMRDWLGKLKEVVYDVEDVVDDFNVQTPQAKQAGDAVESNLRKRVRNSLLSLKNKVPFRHEIGKMIQDIRKRLDEIAKERAQFHLSEMSVARPIQIRAEPYTSPLIDPSTVIGREKEKDELIKEMLMSNESISEKHFSVIPVVGLGGLGKTTFARLVYNNEEVKQHFEVKGRVCPSDRFEGRRVIKEIVESITEMKCDAIYPENILKNYIEGKRFLIVIDDVWEDALDCWDVLRIPFICGNQGSKLIVTTRSERVAFVMGKSALFRLEGLLDEDCLKMFLRKAFMTGDEENHQNLVDIGKSIVKKCGGVPLAINTLGGLLTFKRNESDWNGVLESSFWKLPQKENSILPVLRLSYHHLPPKAKQCFAFCSIFPKDWPINKNELIRMWMALGYIQPDEWREAEVAAGEYFNDLLMISFFSHDPEYENCFTMHDLVYDLAESLGKEECITLDDDKLDLIPEKNNIPQRARHVSLFLSENVEKVSFDIIKSLRRLRTFVDLTHYAINSVELNGMDTIEELKFLRIMCLGNGMLHGLLNVIGCFPLLRYLDISYSYIEELPDSICSLSNLQTLKLEGCPNLKKLPNVIGCFPQLRCFDLTYCHIEELPDSFCSLSNLQTLNLRDCLKLTKLPNIIGCCMLKKLLNNPATFKNLRYLNLFDCDRLTYMPTHIGKLTNLIELTRFIVGKEVGTKIVELKGLNSLKGKLVVERLENVVGGEEAKEANLKNKQLGSLELFWTLGEARDGSIDEDVLENLQPHFNLELLMLQDYEGTYLPSWLSNLPSLKKLYLNGCSELASLPEDLEKLGSLQHLCLVRCHKISSLPRSGLPESLKSFAIYDSPLLEKSCERINGSDWAKIAHIPKIDINLNFMFQ